MKFVLLSAVLFLGMSASPSWANDATTNATTAPSSAKEEVKAADSTSKAAEATPKADANAEKPSESKPNETK